MTQAVRSMQENEKLPLDYQAPPQLDDARGNTPAWNVRRRVGLGVSLTTFFVLLICVVGDMNLPLMEALLFPIGCLVAGSILVLRMHNLSCPTVSFGASASLSLSGDVGD